MKVLPHSINELVIPQVAYRGFQWLLKKDLRMFFASVMLLVHFVVIAYFVKGDLYYYKVFAYSNFDPLFFQMHFIGMLPVSITAGVLGVLGYFVALCKFDVSPGFSEKAERWFVWSFLLVIGVYLVSTFGWCLLAEAPNRVIQRSFYYGNVIGGILAFLGIVGIIIRAKHLRKLPRWVKTILSMFPIAAGSLFLYAIGKTTVWHIVDVIL